MKNFDSIEEALNVDTEVVEDNKIEPRKNQLKKDDKNDSEKDYEYSRANLYSLVEKGQEAVNGILELAQESDSARAYEVAATTIKAVADTTDKLIDLQQKMKDLEQDPNKGPTNVTNALFVGSTAELSKLIKNQNKDDNETFRPIRIFNLLGKAKKEKRKSLIISSRKPTSILMI